MAIKYDMELRQWHRGFRGPLIPRHGKCSGLKSQRHIRSIFGKLPTPHGLSFRKGEVRVIEFPVVMEHQLCSLRIRGLSRNQLNIKHVAESHSRDSFAAIKKSPALRKRGLGGVRPSKLFCVSL